MVCFFGENMVNWLIVFYGFMLVFLVVVYVFVYFGVVVYLGLLVVGIVFVW